MKTILTEMSDGKVRIIVYNDKGKKFVDTYAANIFAAVQVLKLFYGERDFLKEVS